MRIKATILTLCVLATSMLQAQITINVGDFVGTGTTLTHIYDETPGDLSVGPAGASQTWDLSMMPVDSIEMVDFVPPANTLSGSFFPTSNLAAEAAEDTSFYRVLFDRVEIVGLTGDFLGVNQNLRGVYNDNQQVMVFPSTFNTSFTDTALLDSTLLDDFSPLQATTDSGRIKRLVITTSVIDGWGTVTTPAGTYNCLRQYVFVTTIDSVWLRFLGQTNYTEFLQNETFTHHYRWWASGEDFPVAELETNAPAGNVISAYFKLGDNLVAASNGSTAASCFGDCDGTATAEGLGGTGNYTYDWDAGAGNQNTATALGLCAGTYSVTVSDGVNDATVTVTVNEPPVLEMSAELNSETSDLFDGSIDLAVVGGVPPYSYSWTGPNGYTSSDADIEDLEMGLYTIIATDDNGCTITDSYDLLFNSVSEIDPASALIVYPNPTEGQLFLGNLELKPEGYSVMNLLGVQVAQSSGGWNGQLIDLSNMPQGVYLLKIQLDGAERMFRVQKR